MGRKKDPEATFRRAREKGCKRNTAIVNNNTVLKKLEPQTEKNYQRKLDLWDRFVQENPKASPYNLESLKDFVRNMAFSVDGMEGNDTAALETVRNYWNCFSAGWRRKHPEIPTNIAESVTNVYLFYNPLNTFLSRMLTTNKFIYGPLAEEMKLPAKKRPTRFANKSHLLHFARQLWKEDWFEYQNPSTRVDDWALTLGNVYSSSRIGEYIESSCRAGTGRGLYFRDIILIAFLNEYGEPELAMQLTKDAKNMTATPHKRPQHALYEGNAPDLLCYNSILPYLAKMLVLDAFRDYSTIEGLFGVVPSSEDEVVQIHWKEELLDTPFFVSQSTKGAGKIETAAAFGKRHADLGGRAGFPKPPTIHNWRAEGLFLTDKGYSQAQRMKYAGHNDPLQFNKNYQPNNSGVDGVATFLRKEKRERVNDLFRGLTLPRNPNLWHCLPAAKQYEVENSQEFLDLKIGKADVKTEEGSEHTSPQKQLYGKKRKLMNKELREWQRAQPCKPDDLPGYHRTIFDRCRFMMPERDRLAENLFEVAPLRSPIGLDVIHDMVTLCKQPSEVEFRLGLEPDKCCCSDEEDRAESGLGKSYRWRHIYNCYKKDRSLVYGFAELCFLCNEWIFGEDKWNDHCRVHLNGLQTFPTHVDPLVHGGVLATAGYCPFCLTDPDPRLPAATRMYQFLNRTKWLEHIHRHIQELDESKPPKCPHPGLQCTQSFDSGLKLQFHLQDVHGIDFIKKPKQLKRSRGESEDVQPVQQKRQRQRYKEEPEIKEGLMEFSFITATPRTMSGHASIKSATSSGYSTSTNSIEAEERDCGTETLLSPVYDEILIDPKILHQATPVSVLDNIEVVDLTGVHDILEPKCSIVVTTQNDSARDTMGDPSADRANMQGENLGSESSLDVEIKFTPDNAGDDEGLNTNHNPWGAMLRHAEQRKSVDTAEDLAYDRPPAIDPEDSQWKVEKLVKKRRIGRTVQYRVKWLGYPDSENTWEKKKDIDPETVAAFEAGLLLAQDLT